MKCTYRISFVSSRRLTLVDVYLFLHRAKKKKEYKNIFNLGIRIGDGCHGVDLQRSNVKNECGFVRPFCVCKQHIYLTRMSASTMKTL